MNARKGDHEPYAEVAPAGRRCGTGSIKRVDEIKSEKSASPELSPEVFFACVFHLALALGTRMHIPYSDIAAATLQAQTSRLTSERRSDIGNDASHNDILNAATVLTRHGRNLLIEHTTPLIHVGLISTRPAAIFQFYSHYNNK